jgi:O-antigen/teichoic acid export membrane protein
MEIKETGAIGAWINKYRQNASLSRMLTMLSIDILTRLSNIILLPVYLRLMTQEEYGLYNYILSIVTTFSVILNFGLYVSQAKYYSDEHGSQRGRLVLFNIAVLLSVLLAGVMLIVYGFGFDYRLIKFLFKDDIGYAGIRWALLLAILVSVYTVILANYLVTTEKIAQFRKYNLWRLILVNVTVLVTLYLLKGSKIHVRLLYTYLAELVILLVFSVQYLRDMTPVIDKRIIANALKLGLPVMVSAIGGMLSNYGDKYFLEQTGSAKDLSYYYLAFSIANVLYMICLAVHNSWMPGFLREKNFETNMRRTKRLMTRLFFALLALSLLLVLAFWIALQWKIISPRYSPALPILPFLLVAQILSGIILLCSVFMVYFEKTHISLFIALITSAVGLVFSWLLVPVWGTYGAVAAYLIVQFAYLGLYYWAIRYYSARLKK